MEDGTIALIMVLGFCLILAVSMVVHEILETPYDKCLDSCNHISQERNPELFVECVKDCNVNIDEKGGGE